MKSAFSQFATNAKWVFCRRKDLSRRLHLRLHRRLKVSREWHSRRRIIPSRHEELHQNIYLVDEGIRLRSAHLEVKAPFIVSPTKECKMNRIQRALIAIFFAASFMVSGMAPAQVRDSSGGANYGLEVPVVEADPASAVRGSLGVSLENLSLKNNLGKLVFLLNGGFALLAGAVACFAVARLNREPIRDHDHLGDWRSVNSVTST